MSWRQPGQVPRPNRKPGFVERWMSGGARATLIGALIVALGVAISAFIAVESGSTAHEADSKSFDSMASDLGSAVDSKLDTDIGLTRTMGPSPRSSRTPARRVSCGGRRSCSEASRPSAVSWPH
jgi:hypothetical protein